MLQRNITVVREMNELDKIMVALLLGVNRLASRFKVIRRLFGAPLAEKILSITVFIVVLLKKRVIVKHEIP